MRRQILRSVLLVVSTISWSSAVALDPQTCEERLKSVDERIASGKYSEQNVQIARQMRASVVQSCGFIGEETLSQMMEGFEQLLPTRSEAERKAYEEAKRAERDAKRETQRAEREVRRAERARAEAERQAREAKKPPVPAVLKQPPTGKTTMARFVDRDDALGDLEIHDWDYFNGNARVLYQTYASFHSDPSLSPENRPGAQRHYYVVEVDDSGNRARHYVRELPIGEFAVAGLRPGHDEVVFQLRPGARSGPKSTLERWSISTGELLSSVQAPALPWSDAWNQWKDMNFFRLTTNDGDIFFAGHRPTARDGKTAMEWLKATPDGRVVGKGILRSDTESTLSTSSFRNRDGGAVLVTYVKNFDDGRGIDSELETPVVHNIGGVEIKGVVGLEIRLLTVDRNGRVAGQTAALDRQMEWYGLDKLTQISSSEALQEASSLVYNPAIYGESNTVRSFGARGGNAEAIATAGDGYGVVLSASDPGAEQPNAIGDWFFDYSTDGDVRKTHLEPAAEHLGARFRMATASDDDTVFLFASGTKTGPYVVQLDANREIVAYAALSMGRKTDPVGMLADRRGVWVFGETHGDGRLQKMWLERIDFD